MIVECIKKGFHLTHKNWQVILIQMVVTIINLIGLVLFVGVPIAVAITSLGIDIANAKDILLKLFESPMEFLSRYLGLAILIFIALILYLTAASVVVVYVFGGILGVLRNTALDVQHRFTLSSFFKEAKKLFFPLMGLFSIALLIMIVVLVILGMLAGIVIPLKHAYSQSGARFPVFMVSFLNLLTIFLIFLGIIISLASVIFTAYAVIALVVEKKGIAASLKKTWNFIKNKPLAFLFYLILVVGIMSANLILMVLGELFRTFPAAELLIVNLYLLISYVVQIYFGIVMWSSLLVFYIKTTGYHVAPVATTYDI